MFDDRGAANSGLIVLVVVLIIAIVAFFFLWPGGAGEEDAELELEVSSRPAVVQPIALSGTEG